MLKFFVLLCLASLGLCYTVNLDYVVDRTLPIINKAIKDAKKDVLEVEDLELHSRIPRRAPFKMPLDLHCTGGWIKSLASMQRTGGVVGTFEPHRITIVAEMGLGETNVGYDACTIKLAHFIQVRQHFQAYLTSNSVRVQVTLNKEDGNCTSSVDKIELVKLGRVKIKTGVSLTARIKDTFLKIFANIFEEEIISKFKELISDDKSKSIIPMDFCKVFEYANVSEN